MTRFVSHFVLFTLHWCILLGVFFIEILYLYSKYNSNLLLLFLIIGAVGGDGGDDADDKEKAEEEERERQEAIREAEERRKEKHRRMEEEREKMRQDIRDNVKSANNYILLQIVSFNCFACLKTEFSDNILDTV